MDSQGTQFGPEMRDADLRISFQSLKTAAIVSGADMFCVADAPSQFLADFPSHRNSRVVLSTIKRVAKASVSKLILSDSSDLMRSHQTSQYWHKMI